MAETVSYFERLPRDYSELIMSVEAQAVAALTAAGITAYPMKAPTGASPPFVVYQRISTDPLRSHDGTQMEQTRLQVTCWAEKYNQALSTAETVKQALDLNQLHFKISTKAGEFDMVEPEVNLYRRVLDFLIWT